jgi:hypothetical protein
MIFTRSGEGANRRLPFRRVAQRSAVDLVGRPGSRQYPNLV